MFDSGNNLLQIFACNFWICEKNTFCPEKNLISDSFKDRSLKITLLMSSCVLKEVCIRNNWGPLKNEINGKIRPYPVGFFLLGELTD